MDELRTFLAAHSKVFQELTEDATIDELLTGYECDRSLLARLPGLHTDKLKLSNCVLDDKNPYDSIADCTEDQLRMLLNYIDYLDLPKDLEERINELLKNGKNCENCKNYIVYTIAGDVPFDKTNTSHWAVIGDIRGLRWAKEEQNYPWDENTDIHACGPYGSLDCLRYAFAQTEYPPPLEKIKHLNQIAAKYKTLEYLQYLQEKGVLTTSAFLGAASVGNLNNLRFIHESAHCNAKGLPLGYQSGAGGLRPLIHESGIPLIPAITAIAAQNGHLHILKYANEHKCKWSRETCRWAASNGHFDCLRYAYENGASLPIDLYDIAIEQDSLECIKFMYEIGFGIPNNICQDAASNGNLEMLKFCHQKGAQLNQSTYIRAIEKGHLDCLRYIYETGTKFIPTLGMVWTVMYGKSIECREYMESLPEWKAYELSGGNATT